MGALASTGCGPLAPVVDEALEPTLDAVDTCCHGLEIAEFAQLARAEVIEVPAGQGILGEGPSAVRVTALATTRRLDPGLAAGTEWDGDAPITAADDRHELVLALITRVEPGGGTGDMFTLRTLDLRRVTGSSHDIVLFPDGGATDPGGTPTPAAMTTVLVTRVFQGAEIWLGSADDPTTSTGINLRTGPGPAGPAGPTAT